MSTKKTYLKLKSERKLKRINYLLKALMLFMALVVLYDSIRHETPLYYIGFYWVGLIGGRVYRRLMRIEHKGPLDDISLNSSIWNIVLTVLLLLFRFSYGLKLLEFAHVVYASDALYLFFIGLYRSKLKGMIWQIDEIVYRWILKLQPQNEMK